MKVPPWVLTLGKKTAYFLPSIAMTVGVIMILAGSFYRWFEPYELQTYDWRFKMRAMRSEPSDIVIIGIHNDALEAIGRWPFDREYHAVLLEALSAYGAKMVGFDVLFSEPSASDNYFAEASANNQNVFFCNIAEGVVGRKDGKVMAQSSALEPVEPLRKAARGVGHVNAVVDIDGSRRRIHPLIQAGDRQIFYLGILMALHDLGVDPADVKVSRRQLKVGDKVKIPLTDYGAALVDYRGRWEKSFKLVSYLQILSSYRQVLSGEKPDWDLEQLRGKVCFVGLTATGTHDINPVPTDPLYPQVGTHAQAYDNVVNSNFIYRIPRTANLIVLALLCFAAFFLSRISRISTSILAAAGTWMVFVSTVIALFVFCAIWVNFFYPSVIFGLIYLGSIAHRTFNEMRKRELLETELSIASKIQRSFLPAKLPESDFFEATAYMHPAKHVGGDLYDVVKLTDNLYGVMCGDVSGKGMPAALFMAKAVAEFKFHSSGKDDPALVMTGLNDSLSASDGSGLFVTMNYAVIDIKERLLTFTTGGHNPVIRVRADGSSEQLNPEGGMPIGLMPGIEFGNLALKLEPGDIFVMYSDGISEARNRQKKDFEIERLEAATKKYHKLDAKTIQEKILADVEKFVNGAPQHDDMTVVIIKIKA